MRIVHTRMLHISEKGHGLRFLAVLAAGLVIGLLSGCGTGANYDDMAANDAPVPPPLETEVPRSGFDPAGPVFLEELTWPEVRDALAAGWTTILIPTGGVEQGGPHLALGKHNAILRVTAERIARRLGDALVAPVIAYVPEGEINPPTGHMRYPGTITLPDETFRKLLESTARSFRTEGFKDIVLLGDSGGNQEGMRQVAELLNNEWAGSGVHVYFIDDYYSGNGFHDWLLSQGETEDAIGTHAGIEDTSQLMAAAPEMVRTDRLDQAALEGSGVTGDPTRASAEYGQRGLDMKVDAAVAQIEKLRGAAR